MKKTIQNRIKVARKRNADSCKRKCVEVEPRACVIRYAIRHKNDVGFELVKGDFWKFLFSALDW